MEIDFNKLEVGTVLERNIIGKDGTLVLSKGTKITSENLQRLRNFMMGKNHKNHLQLLKKLKKLLMKLLEKR